MNVIVLPTRANKIRAYAEEHPELTVFQVAHNLRPSFPGLLSGEVRRALGVSPKRRIKSIAK